MSSAFASAMPRGFKSAARSRTVLKKRRGVSISAELIRVVNMPRRSLEVYDESFALALSLEMRREGSNFCLKTKQAAMLVEAVEARGLFGMLGVGGGKTVVAPLFGMVLQLSPVVLLVPPSLKIEITQKVIPWLRKEIDFEPPHVVSYAELSTVAGGDVLDRLRPRVIVLDEVHNLKNKAAARTKRFLRYMAEHPNTIVIALSGTITRRSLMDFWHIIQLSHKGPTVPVTTSWREAKDWASALDPQVPEDQRMLPGALLRLCRPGEEARAGFNRRLIDTEGVIGGSAEDVGASLVFKKIKPVVPPKIEEALTRLRKFWETPGGEAVSDAKDFARKARELSQGFYYVWDWPDGKPDQEWLDARKLWRQTVAEVTKLNREGLDSELLVRQAAIRALTHEVRGELPKSMQVNVVEAWRGWDSVRARQEPPTRAIWIDDFLVRAALEWALGMQDGIVWYDSRAVQERAEQLGAVVCAAGNAGNQALLDYASRPSVVAGGPPIVVFASNQAHGTGKNLQRWCANLVLAPWAGGATWEQTIGRTHRPGQEADDVTVDVFTHTPELEKSLGGALEQARFIEQLTGGAQKMLLGTWMD